MINQKARDFIKISDDGLGILVKEREAILFFHIIMYAVADAINPSVKSFGYCMGDYVGAWFKIRKEAFEWLMSDETSADYPTFRDMAGLAFIDADYAVEGLRKKVLREREARKDIDTISKLGTRLMPTKRTLGNRDLRPRTRKTKYF